MIPSYRSILRRHVGLVNLAAGANLLDISIGYDLLNVPRCGYSDGFYSTCFQMAESSSLAMVDLAEQGGSLMLAV